MKKLVILLILFTFSIFSYSQQIGEYEGIQINSEIFKTNTDASFDYYKVTVTLFNSTLKTAVWATNYVGLVNWGTEVEVCYIKINGSNKVILEPQRSLTYQCEFTALKNSQHWEKPSWSINSFDWKEYNGNTNNNNSGQNNQFTDNRDGRTYKVVKIGNQIWMAENLAYNTGSGCWAYNNNQNNVNKYGYLYNFNTAQNACPDGWYLPSDDDWKKLEQYLGMPYSEVNERTHPEEHNRGKSTNIAYKLMSNTGWNANNGTNSSGFNALPGGIFYNNNFGDAEGFGYWWTNTIIENRFSWYREMGFGGSITRSNCTHNHGYSVRCIQDN